MRARSLLAARARSRRPLRAPERQEARAGTAGMPTRATPRRYHDVEPKGGHMDKIEEPGVLIVGFEVKATSIDHRYEVRASAPADPSDAAQRTGAGAMHDVG